MELDNEQKSTIAGWVAEGLGLGEIQVKLREDMGLSMTYMDVRFLVLELGLEVQDKVEPVARIQEADVEQMPEPAGPHDGTLPEGVAPASVSVDVDRVMKPGSLVSGSVTFSDGVTASWALDQVGRLALEATQPGYKPGREDVAAFQQELRTALERRGF